MIFKITFFSLTISAKDWVSLFAKILYCHYKFDLFIKKNGNKIDFFIQSKKNIAALNHGLYPFCISVTNEFKNEKEILNKSKTVKVGITNKSLFDLVEKTKIDNQDIDIIHIKINRLNPIKSFLIIKMIYIIQNKRKCKKIFLARTLDQFLAFDLSRSINIEVDKVKAKLIQLNQDMPVDTDGIIETDDLKDDKCISVKSFDFFRHGLIVGQSGCGKSVLIKLLIDNIYKYFSQDYSVVLIDPHDSITSKIDKKIDLNIIDFYKKSTNLFYSSQSPILSTELTCDLFSTVIPIRENHGMMRVLKFSLTLLFELNCMSFSNLKKLLTDILWRKTKLKETDNKPILDFFETEYQSLYTSQYSTMILPILNLISEVDFVDNENNERIDLFKSINKNFLTVLPVSSNKFGSKIAKIIGGAVIQQVFTLAQENKFNKKVVLIVDEMSIIQNPSLVHILSEARKFGLTLILSQQYLSQVSPELLQSIITNVVNYLCFKVNRSDAEILSRNLNLEIEEYFLKNKNDPREEMELGTKILTDLDPQEMIVRIMNQNKYYRPFKGKTINITNFDNQ